MGVTDDQIDKSLTDLDEAEQEQERLNKLAEIKVRREISDALTGKTDALATRINAVLMNNHGLFVELALALERDDLPQLLEELIENASEED